MKFSKAQLVLIAGLVALMLAWVSFDRDKPRESVDILEPDDTRAPSVTLEAPATTQTTVDVERGVPLTMTDNENEVVEVTALRIEDFCPEYLTWRNNQQSRDNSAPPDRSDLMTAVKNLSTSDLAEHLTVSALLRPSTEEATNERVRLIGKAIEKDPRNRFHYWYGVHACNLSPTPSGCPNVTWENTLVELDGQNSASWMAVAVSRFARGDETEAYKALQQAGASAQSNVYWTDSIRISDASFDAAGVTQPMVRTALALNAASQSGPAYQRYFNMCLEQSERSVEWAQACSNYGQRSAKQPGNILDTIMALTIQARSLKTLGDLEASKRVEDQLTQLRAEYAVASKFDFDEMEGLALGVPTLFQEYLEVLDKHGELKALKWRKARVADYIRNDPDQACTTMLDIYSLSEQLN